LIIKMRYANIIGNTKDIVYIIDKYISKFDMHLELATKELDDLDELELKNKFSFDHDDLRRKANYILKLSSMPLEREKDNKIKISQQDAIKILEQAVKFHEQKNKNLTELLKTREEIKNLINNLEHFKILDINFSELINFKFIKYKFGSMPLNNYKQYKFFLFDDKHIFVIRCDTLENKVWCIYFVHDFSKQRAQEIFMSLNFEEINLPFEINNIKLTGSIAKIIISLKKNLEEINLEIKKIKSNLEKKIESHEIIAAQKVFAMLENFDIEKFAAAIKKKFFIFTGWMPEEIFLDLEKKIRNDDRVVLISGKNNNSPPVSLLNNMFFTPFEFLVRLYGLPSYYEIDPTPFLAITYTVLFGLMFGDVGQGFILFLIGILSLIKKNKNALMNIMIALGFSSMVFGFLYGSIFGFENIIKPIWMRPSDNINFILVFAVLAGIFLILVSMVFNLINCRRAKDFTGMFFGANGFVGLIFYICVLCLIAFYFFEFSFAFKIIAWILCVISLVLIALSDLIKKILRGERKIFGTNLFLFCFETVINLFETILSYFTNTISFVRVGAFALSHAGMMSVVMLLSKSESGSYNWFVIILGNILVIILEGLVVGIQVLRLEFYEMFGRFFRAGGREYISRKKY